MRTVDIIFLCIILLVSACGSSSDIAKEPWINKPVSEWPDFALTNDIGFKDTTYYHLANSFLVNTGSDTLGVSCKHLFMVFEMQIGLQSIDLGENFNYWKMYPRNHPDKIVMTKQLINRNPSEPVGQFNTLKVRDWILFKLEEKHTDLYPLKIRYKPVKTNEVMYAVGWGAKQKNNRNPALIKMQCVKNIGEYFYIKSMGTSHQPHGRSGSAVIDKNGYLVGIVSGAEGNLGVIGSVKYLRKLLDQYGIEYVKN